jgi:hypothetical protein
MPTETLPISSSAVTRRTYHRSWAGIPKWGVNLFFIIAAGICIFLAVLLFNEDRRAALITMAIGIALVAVVVCYVKFLSLVRVSDSGLDVRGFVIHKQIAWQDIDMVVGERKQDSGLPALMKVQVMRKDGRKATFRVSYGPGVRLLEQLRAQGVKILSDLPQFNSQ